VRPDGFLSRRRFRRLQDNLETGRGFRSYLRLWHVTPRTELLHALESHRGGAETCALHLLPGHYAFVVKAVPGALLSRIQTSTAISR
jgi:hypothetical protein